MTVRNFASSLCPWKLRGTMLRGGVLGNEKCARSFFAQTFWTPPGVRDIPAKFPGHPGFLSSKPKEDKVSRAGTKFSATTPSRGRPPPHRAVSGPKNLIFVLFFLAWSMAFQFCPTCAGRSDLAVLEDTGILNKIIHASDFQFCSWYAMLSNSIYFWFFVVLTYFTCSWFFLFSHNLT